MSCMCLRLRYTLLINYSNETLYCCWADSLLLAQISMMYYESAPKNNVLLLKAGAHRSIRCMFVVSLASLFFWLQILLDLKFT